MKINDFIEIKNYYKKAGQSGKLGVAIDKDGKKYLLKGGNYTEPANEYVYSLIAKKLGVSCQKCHLVEGFEVPVVAFDYIEPMSKAKRTTFDENLIIDEKVKAITLDGITWQDDIFQYIISKDGQFYKIDNSEAFAYDKLDVYCIEKLSTEQAEKHLNMVANNFEGILGSIRVKKAIIIKEYGEHKIVIFNKILEQFLKTDFNFILQDKDLQKVYPIGTMRFFLAKINAMKKATSEYFRLYN